MHTISSPRKILGEKEKKRIQYGAVYKYENATKNIKLEKIHANKEQRESQESARQREFVCLCVVALKTI